MITDWDAYGASWDQHSEKLAPTLNTTHFHLVSSAFGCLASLARSREIALQEALVEKPKFDISDNLLAIYEANIEAAKRIVLKVSFRWWEIRERRKALAS